MTFDERMAALPGDQRQHFYEVLEHHLSCQMRYVVMDDGLSDAEKVGRLSAINEILHLVTAKTAKVWVGLRNAPDWSDEGFGQVLERWAEVHPEIENPLTRAVEKSFREVTEYSQ
jgi:hypothetical protein